MLGTRLFIIFQLILVGLLWLNGYFFESAFVGLLLGGIFILINSYALGIGITNQTKIYQNLIYGSLLFWAINISAGAIIYFFYRFDWPAVLVLQILIAGIATYSIHHKQYLPFKEIKFQSLKLVQVLWLTVYAVFFVLTLLLAFQGRTTEAIASPWHILSPKIFLTFGLASLAYLYLILHKSPKYIVFGISSLHFFLTMSLTYIVYKLGYGFDPFIHTTTEKYIFEMGEILPKPLYYLGQYSLVVYLAKITALRLEIIDKLLVLFMATVYLPPLIYHSLQKFFNIRKYMGLAIVGFLIIPYTYFNNTTPYSLSLFFFLATILISIQYFQNKEKTWLFLTFLMSLASLAIHPLVGLPAVVYFLLIFAERFNRYWQWGATAFGVLISPLAFVIQSKLNNFPIKISDWQTLAEKFDYSSWFPLVWQHNYYPIKDIVYAYAFNLKFILLLLALWGFYLLKQNRVALYPIIISLILLLNSLIIKYAFDFEALIDYEKQIFANRYLELALIALTPLILYSWQWIFNSLVRNKRTMVKIFAVTIIMFSILIAYYVSYPRKDDYVLNKGYSVSDADFHAAQTVQTKSTGQPYIVLANQNTSAAALKLFGFQAYYNGHFYYPLPTSSPLYSIFYDMMQNGPRLEKVEQARLLTGVTDVYFMVPEFWHNSPGINDAAKQIADSTFKIDTGRITVHYFTK